MGLRNHKIRVTLGSALLLCLSACGDEGNSDGTLSGSGGPTGDGDGDGDGDSSGDGDGDSSGDGDGDSGSGDGDGDSSGGSTDSGGDGDGDSDSSGGTDDTGCGSFVTCADMGGPMGAECDLWLQDCPEGLKCLPYDSDGDFGWDSAKCSTLSASPKAPGDACMAPGAGLRGEDDCDLGDMCYEVQKETDMGSCTPMCVGSPTDPTCDDADRGCFISNDGFLILCLQRCDPLLGDCEGDTSCLPSNGGKDFLCRLNISTTMGFYGDPCYFNNACQPGLYCAPSVEVPGCTANGCCNEFCDVTSDEPCPGAAMGQECIKWYAAGTEPPGFEDLGSCGIP